MTCTEKDELQLREICAETELFSDVPVPEEREQAAWKRPLYLSAVFLAALGALAAVLQMAGGYMEGGATVRRSPSSVVLVSSIKGSKPEIVAGVKEVGAVSVDRKPWPNFTTSSNIGCGNWRRIAFHEAITTATAAECAKACSDQPGCKFANFQTEHPGQSECSENWSLSINACYFFAEDCVQANNSCWDLLEPDAASLQPEAFNLTSQETGCKNWREAKLGDVRQTWNRYECAWLCQWTTDCVQFGYQSESCEGDAKECAEQEGQGACYLYDRPCEPQDNKLWDLYSMLDTSPTSTTAGAPETTKPL